MEEPVVRERKPLQICESFGVCNAVTFGEPVIQTDRTNLTIENDIAAALLSNYTPSKISGLKRHSVKLPEAIPEEDDEGQESKT
jgi:hypothetical protein